MILDGMTGIEVLEELEKYADRIDDFIKRTLRSNEKEIRRRLRRRPKDKVDFKVRTLTFPDQKFYIILYPWIMKSTNGLGADYSLYTIVQNKYSGKKSIVHFPTQEGTDYMVIYENHLLKRYRDRFLGLGQDEINFEDLAEKFIRDCQMATMNVNDNGNVEGRILNGILLGNVEDEYTIRFKTFITSEMATRDYQEDVRTKNLETLIEELEENETNKILKLGDDIIVKAKIN